MAAGVIMIYTTGAHLSGAIPPVVKIIMRILCSNAFGAETPIAMHMERNSSIRQHNTGCGEFGSVTIV